MKAATCREWSDPLFPLISIHAAREGGDSYNAWELPIFAISIHAAREGGDRTSYQYTCKHRRFQFTPPVKAATGGWPRSNSHRKISIHAAREGGDAFLSMGQCPANISIHAAREGGDWKAVDFRSRATISIHAAREGGDKNGKVATPQNDISIHAAREGGDVCTVCYLSHAYRFQSTPPVKAATQVYNFLYCNLLFQSTPPVKAATQAANPSRPQSKISIHAAREGGDGLRRRHLMRHGDFNPRRP